MSPNWTQINSILESIPYRCPLKQMTGLECGFCGMTHSWIAMVHGEWIEAFRYNWFGPPLMMACLLLFVILVLPVTRRKFFKLLSSLSDQQKKTVAWMGIFFWTSYAVIRNLI
jgi:hypothetical protein